MKKLVTHENKTNKQTPRNVRILTPQRPDSLASL